MEKKTHQYVDVICTHFKKDAEGYRINVAEIPMRFERKIWDNKISKMKFGNKEFRLAPIEPIRNTSPIIAPIENQEIDLTQKQILAMNKSMLISNLCRIYGGTPEDWQFTNKELKEKLIASLIQVSNT